MRHRSAVKLHERVVRQHNAIDHFKTESGNFGNQMRTRSRGVFQPITQEQLTSPHKSLVRQENSTIPKFLSAVKLKNIHIHSGALTQN